MQGKDYIVICHPLSISIHVCKGNFTPLRLDYYVISLS